jgi:hypothetical protein
MVRRLCGLHREAVAAMVDGHRSLEKLGRIAAVLAAAERRRESDVGRGAGFPALTDMMPLPPSFVLTLR